MEAWPAAPAPSRRNPRRLLDAIDRPMRVILEAERQHPLAIDRAIEPAELLPELDRALRVGGEPRYDDRHQVILDFARIEQRLLRFGNSKAVLCGQPSADQ